MLFHQHKILDLGGFEIDGSYLLIQNAYAETFTNLVEQKFRQNISLALKCGWNYWQNE